MAYRFNFTDRKKISRSLVELLTRTSKEGLEVAARVRLGSCRFPNGAHVLIEAYRGAIIHRFDCGLIEAIIDEIHMSFPGFKDSQGVMFRVKVVDTETKRILGLAERLRPINLDAPLNEYKPLLQVAFAKEDDEIGDLFWMVAYDRDTPVLLLNKNSVDALDQVKSDQFKALVLPEVLREVLTKAFVVEALAPPVWGQDWIDFSTRHLGVVHGAPSGAPLPTELANEYLPKTVEWINAAVRSFAVNQKISKIQLFK